MSHCSMLFLKYAGNPVVVFSAGKHSPDVKSAPQSPSPLSADRQLIPVADRQSERQQLQSLKVAPKCPKSLNTEH